MDTLCINLHLKNKDNRGAQHQVTGLSFPYRGIGVKRPEMWTPLANGQTQTQTDRHTNSTFIYIYTRLSLLQHKREFLTKYFALKGLVFIQSLIIQPKCF